METFDITGPLPTGTTLLEASAGTGKTWTIAALVTRYVAEGVATLEEMLVVTFTRAASQELRDRVRGQLDEAAAVLADPTSADAGNRLHDWLLDADEPERTLRRSRLTDALTSYDAATIATIHQFCQLVLRSLGVAGDTDTGAVLVEDLEQLTSEVTDDLYLGLFARREATTWSHETALTIARAVVGDPRANVAPQEALAEDPDGQAAERVRFASEVLDEIDRRKRRLGVLSYDDLLIQLAEALRPEDSPARARMRQRWKIALIDEFQDTDPVQWEVFERAFHGAATLVLIGDPKQAIYAFRGGDIVTYLKAAEQATTRQTLAVNRRADRPLLDSLQVLIQGASLGDDRIPVHPVTAHHQESRLDGVGAPFRLRVVRHEELGRRKPRIGDWRTHVLTDLAADVKRLLTSGATVGTGADARPVEPKDVAVLAARRADLLAAQEALAAVGVPSVVNAGGSVFKTAAATQWLTLLEALEQPHRADRVRAAALTDFIGRTAEELQSEDDPTDDLSDAVRRLADLFVARGVAAVLEIAVLGGLNERVLGRVGGKRTLTDLRHIGEALHKVTVSERFGVVGLLGWLRTQVADDKIEVASERTRRLDSDAAAVQLVTIHGSKGLEYPIVYLPTLWDRWVRDEEVPLFHDGAGDRCRDVGGPSRWRDAAATASRREDAGESLRLLYVALTRAQSQVVAWYCPSANNTASAPLHRMLFGRAPGHAHVNDEQSVLGDDEVVDILGRWKTAGGPQPELATPATVDTTPIDRELPTLAVRSFDRDVDTDWRRTSYSALAAAGAPHAGAPDRVLSEPDEVPELDDVPLDEVVDDAPAPDVDGALSAVASPMADLPVGAAFGSLVHEVLEHADPAAPDLRAELLAQVEEHRAWWAVEVDAEALADALVAVCDSPLGPLAGDLTLRDITIPDRLRELDFEVPLAGGDLAARSDGPGAAHVVLGDLGPLLRTHLPDGDPLLAFAETLDGDADLAGQRLLGYLTGSIDVVVRVPVDGRTRYVTIDYKTNWLGDRAAPATAWEYRPEVLDEAMGHSDYPLQALLYTVVLHRYLRWRLPGYDPAEHLGGVLYLYLRGMCGPATPRVDGRPCGVFSWQPPVALVTALSDLLDGVAP
ncbi:DNA helicase/exodeoxyribonuclease V, beta subunit [Nocardioides exalbidus]|uniref:RecBCD enzyme subunit RecB n=1 Tax=Nocardioides exalbidus TaxID=402596 RepID=A0A1H4N187_9ACTN|nr:UvrD-helicase domain-containing protein [Nocardioides exalbidus]SEB88495.1 DNA helicase/exodeoxyribonuclease V, beta subunit [Nocardioides exalbidus]